VEWDFGGKITKAQDVEKFTSLVESIRKMGADASISVSVATRSDLTDNRWTPDATAEKTLPDSERQIFQGVDPDALLGPVDRMDDCHFGQSGQEKFAEEWARLLAACRT
jgi:hypothetical protein